MKTTLMTTILSHRIASLTVAVIAGVSLAPLTGSAQGFQGSPQDSRVLIGPVTVTAPTGPDYPSIANGNFTYRLPFGTLNTQSGPLGLADEGLGKGVTAFARANVQANGEVWIRESDGSVSKYAASGVSKDFLLGDLSVISRQGNTVTRVYTSGAKDVFGQATSKGIYQTSSFDPYGNETKFSYDVGSFFPREVASPARESVTTFEKTPDGKIGKVKSLNGDFISLVYSNGYLEKVTDRLGQPVIEIGRDLAGQGLPTTFRSDGKYDLIVSYSVDNLGGTPRIHTIEYANNEKEFYTYGAGQATVKQKLPNGTEYAHEHYLTVNAASGKVVVGQSFLNKSKNPRPVSDVRVNSVGQITSSTNARGQTTRYTYPPGSPLPSLVSHPDGTSDAFTYNATFKPVTYIHQTPAGLITTAYQWNGNQLLKKETKNPSNEVTDVVTYAYAGADLYPTSVTSTQKTSFSLDSTWGKPIQAKLPSGQVIAKSTTPNSSTLSMNGLTFKKSWAYANGALTMEQESPLGKVSIYSQNDGSSEKKEFWRPSSQAAFPTAAGRTYTQTSQTTAAMANNAVDPSAPWFGVENALALPPSGGVQKNNTVECTSPVDGSKTTCTCKTDPNAPCGCTWSCDQTSTGAVPGSPGVAQAPTQK